MSSPTALLAARDVLTGAHLRDDAWTIEAVVLGTPDEAIAVAWNGERRARALIGRAPDLDAAGLADLLQVHGPGSPSLLRAGPLEAPAHPSSLAVAVEELPAGASLRSWWLDRPAGRVGIRALAQAIAAWHASGSVFGGLHPELVFMERPDRAGGEPRISALAPRAVHLWEAAPPADRFVGRCLDDLYAVRASSEAPWAASDDVFALGAIAWHRLTGIHPFGDDRTSQLLAIVAGRMPRPGGTTVARGLLDAVSAALDPDPAGRPTALELSAVFGRTD